VKEIFDIFQKQKYKDRIAIFHYGGHAGDYALLLETPTGEHAIAHSEGLDSFLAKQKGLQLIFINGCCSQKQAQDLIKAGVPAVIGTSQKINDEVATDLSVQFYNALAEGRSLDRAWAEAVDLVTTKKGATSYRDLGGEEMEETEDRFPWEIYYRPGAEVVKEWNLPEAVANPLFGLSEIPKTYNLPETPFLFLKRYERPHAEIFFGRSYYIRDLYNRISDRNAPPIILLYGQSGVGKSSLFDAGLNPRLEKNYEVIYIRRIQEKGLAGSLEFVLDNKLATYTKTDATKQDESKRDRARVETTQVNEQLIKWLESAPVDKADELKQEVEAFLQRLRSIQQPVTSNQYSVFSTDGETFKLLAKWKQIEVHARQPLIVILDQVEELFTRANELLPKELEDFLAALEAMFGAPEQRPLGKLILGYRKEYHPEIDEGFKAHRLPRTTLFLEHLKRKDILDIFRGLTQTHALRVRYNLSVEEELPVIVADDLLESRDSPVAPVLQILLTKMWNATKENPEAPRFTVSQYLMLKNAGIAMGEFFEQQMRQLQAWQTDVVDSGLALDVLYFHTTAMGTADSHSLEEIRRKYQHREDIINELIAKCKEFYLLTETAESREKMSLTHDTLAPVVASQYNSSDKPGQRAARILSNKVSNFRDQQDGIWLDEADLQIVEQGQKGMRQLVIDEEKLLEISRARRAQLEKERRRNRMIRNVLVTAIMVFAGFAGWQTKEADEEKNNSIAADARELAARAIAISGTNREKSLLLAMHSICKSPTYEGINALRQALLRQSVVLRRELVTFSTAVYNSDGNMIVTANFDNTARIWDAATGNTLRLLREHNGEVLSAAFSPDGKQIVTASADSMALIWDTATGKEVRRLEGHKDKVLSATFSPDGKQIVTASADRMALIWDTATGKEVRSLDGHKDKVLSAAFSPDGKQIVTASADRMALIWEAATGKEVKRLKGHKDEVLSAAFSRPDGKRIVTTSADNTARIWDTATGKEVGLLEHTNIVRSATFSPDGKQIVTASADHTARIWDAISAHPLTILPGHSDDVRSAAYSPDGNRIVTASLDRKALIHFTHLGQLIDIAMQDSSVQHEFDEEKYPIIHSLKKNNFQY